MKYFPRFALRKMAGLLENSIPPQPERLLTNSAKDPSRNSAILQYQLGEERFKLKILRNGKVFNFDRLASETVKTIKERMVTNLSKKIKNFDGDIKILVREEEVFDDSMLEILENGLNNLNFLKIQVGEDIFNVDFNPPEISQMKFLKMAMVGFPFFPVKIEATKNFNLKESKFTWELVKEKKKAVRRPSVEKTPKDVEEKCIHNQFVYCPTEENEGKHLRFTCTPSDGHRNGVPFSIETANPVSKSPEDGLLFHERLSRLDSKKDDLNLIRVISYNALADTYATAEWFSFSPAASLDMDYRLPLLNKEILSYNGDIVCLQEVDTKYYEGNFEPLMDLNNYQGAFSSKIGKTKEGVSTFFNRNKFLVLQSQTVVILEHMKSLPMWNSILSKNEALITRLEDRNTVLQVNVVKSKANPNFLLVVANTHLYFHPDADHIRLLQTITCIDYIQSTIEKLKTENPDKTVSLIFCGDFNCTPPFSSFRLLTTGIVGSDDDDWMSHETEQLIPGAEFKHDLGLTNSHPGEELTNITMQFEGCIDYMLYQADKIKLVKAYPPPDKTVLATIMDTTPPKVSMPNFKTPSDHLPLIADFVLPLPVK